MSVGYDVTKGEIDSRSGSIALNIRNTFEQVQALQAWLAGTPDPVLEGLGYTNGEVAQLKSALFDLDQLRTIYEGLVALPDAKDFRAFAKLLIGLN